MSSSGPRNRGCVSVTARCSVLMLLCHVSRLTAPVTGFSPRTATLRSIRRITPSSCITSTRLFASQNKTTDHSNQQQQRIQVPQWVPDFGEGEEDTSGYSRPVVQWYPGHIAKAERLLKETFQAVDVVVEVRDARACKATSHPQVGEWCAGRPRLVVFTHVDSVPSLTSRQWRQYLEDQQQQEWSTQKNNVVLGKTPEVFLWVNAKQGQGIPGLHRAIFKAGAHIQERRGRRGLKDRPLRVGLMGYPNVGKSALINRLLGRRRARTANTPGVTRSLQWIRVRTDDSKKTNKKEYELLDSPGIIPASLEDQADALLLAACHCIGEAAYDNQVVAAYLCQWMQNMLLQGQADMAAPEWKDQCRIRWGFDPLEPVPVEAPFNNDEGDALRYITGEEMLYKVADNTCKGSPEDAARKILQDFRNGRMGPICLQVAPPVEGDMKSDEKDRLADFASIPDPRMGTMRNVAATELDSWQSFQQQQKAERLERAQAALQTAKERGLELPPQLGSVSNDKQKNDNETPDDVGKGLFDGW